MPLSHRLCRAHSVASSVISKSTRALLSCMRASCFGGFGLPRTGSLAIALSLMVLPASFLPALFLPAMLLMSAMTQAAPGGVSEPGFWVRSDDAGTDISLAWKDHSVNANDIEAYVDEEAPWALSAADAQHNFHPFVRGFSRNRMFVETDASFVPSGTQTTPLTVVTVTRNTAFPA